MHYNPTSRVAGDRDRLTSIRCHTPPRFRADTVGVDCWGEGKDLILGWPLARRLRASRWGWLRPPTRLLTARRLLAHAAPPAAARSGPASDDGRCAVPAARMSRSAAASARRRRA